LHNLPGIGTTGLLGSSGARQLFSVSKNANPIHALKVATRLPDRQRAIGLFARKAHAMTAIQFLISGNLAWDGGPINSGNHPMFDGALSNQSAAIWYCRGRLSLTWKTSTCGERRA
jgi:hypothetical protein